MRCSAYAVDARLASPAFRKGVALDSLNTRLRDIPFELPGSWIRTAASNPSS